MSMPIMRQLSLRAFPYVPAAAKNIKKNKQTKTIAQPPESDSKQDRGFGAQQVFAIDVETTTDVSQQLRFGIAHLYRLGSETSSLSWVFYNPDILSEAEVQKLRDFAAKHGAAFLTVDDFIDLVFFKYVYKFKVTCVGANLAFDLPRLAQDHRAVGGKMAGGFRLKLARNLPKTVAQDVIIKSLGGRKTLIQFVPAPGAWHPSWGHPYPGFFVDILQLGHALLARRVSLKSLGDFLKVTHPKKSTDEHGGPLTDEYLDYAWNDVVCTYECFIKLRERWNKFGIKKTEINKIYSEASIAKAILKECGIKPLRETQPSFFDDHPDIIGKIMQGFLGGRVETKYRRHRLLAMHCDMTSMYPMMFTLLGLDRFLIAKGVTWRKGTREVQQLMDLAAREGVDVLESKALLSNMVGIAKVRPDRDMLAIRHRLMADSDPAASVGRDPTVHKAGGPPQEAGRTLDPAKAIDGPHDDNIVLGHLTWSETLWLPIPALIDSAVHNRRTPVILEALIFEPLKPQEGLQPIKLPDGSSIDPNSGNIFKKIVELRQTLKNRRDGYPQGSPEWEELDTSQYMLKILINSGCYGIFVEMIEQKLVRPRGVAADVPDDQIEDGEGPLKPHWKRRICYSGDRAFIAEVGTDELPGRWFHPLLAVLITSAARLMLSCAEICARREDWPDPIIPAYCDTDAWIFGCPEGMSQYRFEARIRQICHWFNKLSPFDPEIVRDAFKLEDANFKPGSKNELEPLYFYGIASKCYALYNIGSDQHPIIRSASAHGLGHFWLPYPDDFKHPDLPPLPDFIKSPAELLTELDDLHRWQYDLWYLIIDSLVLGHGDFVTRLAAHPGFDRPAMIRYTVRTPEIHDWFDRYNAGRLYRDRIRPGGFFSTWTPDNERAGSVHPYLIQQGLDIEAPESQLYLVELKHRGLTDSQIEEIINRDPVDWHPVGPFASDDPWGFKDAFDRVTGLPIPPWILPRTYAQALWDFPDRPELKFPNGHDKGEMEVPHIIAAERVNYIGKASNRFDEASISELSEAGEFVNNYEPVDGRYVPAERARELLTPLLARPAKKAMAEAEREYSKYWGIWPELPNRETSKDEIEALEFLLNTPQLSPYNRSSDEWLRNSVIYILTDRERKTLTQVAAELGVSKSYLSDIISGRRVSKKVPLEQIIQKNLPLRSDHFGIMPENPYYLPAPDPEESEEYFFELMAGNDQAQQLTDGNPQSYANFEACKSMIFNSWEHKILEQEEIRGACTIELHKGPQIKEIDFEAEIAALCNGGMVSEAPDDDDDILNVGDIE